MGFWSNLFGGSKSACNSGTSERKKKSDEDEEFENRSRKATDYFNSSSISSEHIDSINNQTVRPDDPNSPLKYNIHSDDPAARTQIRGEWPGIKQTPSAAVKQ